jgi:hypothetical protein
MTLAYETLLPPEPESPLDLEAPRVALSPPEARAEEEAVLGSVLIDPYCFPALARILKPADFYIRRHAWIWQAYENLIERGEPLDFLTVEGELNRMSKLSDIGGTAFLTVLLNQVPSSLNARTYARAVKEAAVKRRLLDAANTIANLALDPRITAEQASARSLEAVSENSDRDSLNRYVLRDADYALQPQPPIDYLVDNLITNSSVNVLYGEPGSKKTYSALSLAVCVANGKPWLEMQTKQAPVLIIDEESGERRFTRRLGDAIRGELCDHKSPISFVSLAGFKLDGDNDPILIQALIEQTGAKLVIFDALADLMDGDENDKKDVQPVFNHLRKIAEATNSAILVIHHSNKAGGYRGSSAIKGSVDLMVQVTSENGSNRVNFLTEKNRDGERATWAASAIWAENQFYLQLAEKQDQPKQLNKSQEYVIRYLIEHGASPLPDIMDAADTCSDNAAKLAVYSLADLRKVRRTNPGTRPAIYELTEKENQNE